MNAQMNAEDFGTYEPFGSPPRDILTDAGSEHKRGLARLKFAFRPKGFVVGELPAEIESTINWPDNPDHAEYAKESLCLLHICDMLGDPAAEVARAVETFERQTADGMKPVGGKWVRGNVQTIWESKAPDDSEKEERAEFPRPQDLEREREAAGDTFGEKEEQAEAERPQEEGADADGAQQEHESLKQQADFRVDALVVDAQ
jgi:hypothetical protein